MILHLMFISITCPKTEQTGGSLGSGQTTHALEITRCMDTNQLDNGVTGLLNDHYKQYTCLLRSLDR